MVSEGPPIADGAPTTATRAVRHAGVQDWVLVREVLAHHAGYALDGCFKAFAAVLVLKGNMLEHTAPVGVHTRRSIHHQIADGGVKN